MSEKLVVRNIGLMLSGDLEKPILDADTVVAVDGRIAVLGSVNIDMRSLWLNFEISLFIYDRGCVSREHRDE